MLFLLKLSFISLLVLLLFSITTIKFRSIFTYFSGAFSGTAAAGGFIGATVASAIQIGMARGVFANEAGLGSAPIAAAAAKLIPLQSKL